MSCLACEYNVPLEARIIVRFIALTKRQDAVRWRWANARRLWRRLKL